jgi:uncharacterized membrane protein YbhN (UPF0104 family)
MPTPTPASRCASPRFEGAVLIVLDVLDPQAVASSRVVQPRRLRRRGAGQRSRALLGAGVLLAGGALLASPLVDGSAITNGVQSVSLGLGVLVSSSWPWLLALVGVAGLHYVLAALALRAAAGTGWSICLREATKIQLVAAAANRVTPSGLGAATVNARYLSQCGQTPSRSLGSVGAMNVFGALADGGLLLLLLGVGTLLGSHGNAYPGLDGGLRQLVSDPSAVPVPVWVAGGAVLALFAGVAVCSRSRARRAVKRASVAVGQALEQITSMRRRPKDLAVLLLASGGTTLVMGLGLVVSVAAVAGVDAIGDVNAVLVGYLVGAAVGTAIPTPSGIGSTEAALVAVLVTTGLPPGAALSAVLVFRAVTFWAPVPLGLLIAPGLRRRRAL